MRSLITLIILLMSVTSWALPCKQYEKVAEILDTQKFKTLSREARLNKREHFVPVEDINQARAISYRLPAFEELGFGKPGGSGWTSYKGRHPKSGLNGKDIGWETHNNNGHARIRIDWDPEKGAHYNIEITEKNFGKSETYKTAVGFLCGNQKCTEKQFLKMVEKLQ